MYSGGGVKRFALLDCVTHKDKFPNQSTIKINGHKKEIFFNCLIPASFIVTPIAVMVVTMTQRCK